MSEYGLDTDLLIAALRLEPATLNPLTRLAKSRVVVAAGTIAWRTRLVRFCRMSRGCRYSLDAADKGAKARCLQGYLELRWSPEASPG
jgi:hypothetical protein